MCKVYSLAGAMALPEWFSSEGSRVFFTFGGHSVPTWLKELKAYWGKREMEPFFKIVWRSIEAAREILEGAPLWKCSWDLKSWLEKGEADSPATLIYSPVQMPGILITQLAHLYALKQLVDNTDQIYKKCIGTTGHSQGLVVSAFLSTVSHSSLSWEEVIEKYIIYIFVLSYLAQEQFGETPFEEKSPMVALLGGNHREVEEWVEEINSSLTEKIYIGLYNTPTNRILCSRVESLEKFYEKYSSQLEEGKYKWIYLKTSCAFHSPYMQGVPKEVEKKTQEFFSFRREDVRSLPVYSFADGKNIGEEEGSLAYKLAEDLLYNTLYWDKALSSVGSDALILDFGPGKANTRLIQENLPSYKIYLFPREFRL